VSRLKRATALFLIILFIGAAGLGCRLFRQQDPDSGADEDAITFNALELFTRNALQFPDDFPDQAVYLVFFADG
jgi:hypothetical protein